MHLGDLEVHYLDGGTFRLDGGAMFGVVPKVLWEKGCVPDEVNRIRLRANSLLVRSGQKNIVIETGNGTIWDPKLRSIFAIAEGDPLISSLREFGVEPDQVDVVINTHLHFDHAGGNTRLQDNDIVPTFRNARYFVQRSELEHAMNPTERDRASYFAHHFQPIVEAGQWQLLDGDAEIIPGIRVERIPGHNANIQAVVLRSGGKSLAFVADLLPTRHHIPLPWIMAYDLYPLQTLETKRAWIPRLIKETSLVVFGHDADFAVASLQEQGGKVLAKPVDLNS
jgi:glyoxylase-like metal-dependent hydrolase (beta-lactamase superfamily II)